MRKGECSFMDEKNGNHKMDKNKDSQPWWKQWEQIWGADLGWDEKDPRATDLDSIWYRWEKVWCETLGWNYEELKKITTEAAEEAKAAEAEAKAAEAEAAEVAENVTAEEVEKVKERLRTDDESEIPEDRHIALYLFYKMFRGSYTTAQRKKEKNKKMNMQCKRRFIHLFFWFIVIHIHLLLVYAVLLVLGFSISHLTAVEAFVLFILVMSALIIGKDLDINKYQETWSRHTRFQNQRNQEMLRFLLDEKPQDKEKVDDFVKAIMAIEEKNIEKFCDNMDNKEKDMLSEFQSFINKKSGSKSG